MACQDCGAETRPGQKFCAECGVALQRACPNCATAIEGNPKFCPECGTGLQAVAARPTEPASASASAPAAEVTPAALGEPAAWEQQAGGAERKHVSVMFADLVGFTSMSESRDAEAVREQLTEYFSVASDIIGRYGGTVEKFIGDAVMAVWGTPVAHEDDAERAVRAALELVDAVRGMSGSEELNMRVGVLTGEAAVTLGATNQGMVAGDLVNTASRLQSVAPPGTVLVGEMTYRTAARAIVFEPVGEQELKGKASPVPAYRAVRVVARRGGAGRADQLEAPFRGRDAELRLVKELFHATQRDRRPRLVSIMGQAGIGKSRLTWEFNKYIDGIKDRVLWHQGRSPAYGEGITFWALGEMVRSRADLLENDDAAVTRTKLGETLQTYVPDEAERRWITPKLEQLLGIGEADGGGREELFAAWRTFFERVAGDDVAVLVFEESHWADAGLLDFIEHVLTWSRNAPIYIITLARPELVEKRPNWGAGQKNFTNLSLEPLADEVIREILDSLVPGLPNDIATSITARAEGIPLYAVETIRMLLQDGQLEAVNGAFRPIGDLSTLAVPSTLQALIAARLDALDAVDRSLMQQASVLGQTFTQPALSAISGVGAEIEERLLGLVRRELLTVDMDTRSPERGQFGFVQALVREVAYNTLSRRDRKVAHLSAAEYFETLDDEEIVDATAMHYLDAYRSAPEDDDADEARRHAADLLQRAAERATMLGSHDQAVRYLELGLEVTEDAREQVGMLVRAGAAASSAGRYEIAEGYLRRGLEAAQSADDQRAEADAITQLGRALATGGRPAEAITEIEGSLERLTSLSEDKLLVGLYAALGRAHMLSGAFAPAVEWCDRALPLAERLDMPFEIADLLITRATAMTYGGRVREGLAELQGALLLAESYGLGWLAVRARVNLSGSLAIEDPQGALRVGLAGIEDAKRTGHLDMLSTLSANVAGIGMHVGQFDIAARVLEESMASELDPPDRYIIQCIQLIHQAIRGEPYQALLEEAEAFAATWQETNARAQLNSSMGWVGFMEGRYEDGYAASRKSVDLNVGGMLEDLPMAARSALWAAKPDLARQVTSELRQEGGHGRMVHAFVTGMEAGIAAADGRLEEAAAAYGEAIRQWKALDAAFELALCELDYVRFVGGERPDVHAAAEDARATFRAIGSPGLERRLDEAVGLPTG